MTHSESSSSMSDTASDAGWEDIESNDDIQPIVGLFSPSVYPDVHSMLKESRDKHNFDLVKVRKELGV
jgi:protein arginine N-methyltransferase 3